MDDFEGDVRTACISAVVVALVQDRRVGENSNVQVSEELRPLFDLARAMSSSGMDVTEIKKALHQELGDGLNAASPGPILATG